MGGWRGNTQEIDHVLSITAVARGRGQQDGGWVKGGGNGQGPDHVSRSNDGLWAQRCPSSN